MLDKADVFVGCHEHDLFDHDCHTCLFVSVSRLCELVNEENESTTNSPLYSREVLVDVLIYHQLRNVGTCMCGWANLGESHANHIADMYERSMIIKKEKDEAK